MNREYLIQKWLDHALSAEELEAFKKLDDYDALMRLDKHAQKFKAPDFDVNAELDCVNTHLKTKERYHWVKPIMRIAAVAIIGFCITFLFTKNYERTERTLASQKINITLPDASEVTLNALSQIDFKPYNWNNSRTIELEGEAYFKVAKGSRFDVKTQHGLVTVLGTEFNVKQRDHFFEVTCYEGSVGVRYNDQPQHTLKPGEHFLIFNESLVIKDKKLIDAPSWINNESRFKSIPYKYVLKEFERQYNVSFRTEGINLEELFTGNFAHDNYHVAIKSITLPLHLTYSKTNNTILLKGE